MVISKYAYMSEVDPTFAPMKPTVDAQYSAFWGLEPEEFESAWKGLPTSLPEGTPDDLDITHEMVTVRDGAQIEIRVYRKKAAANGPRPIVLVAHGGGWILGNHDVEEGFSRWTATEADATVISVDYRLAPKFKFPYAINDFYDVFKWCKQNATTLIIDPTRIVVAGGSAGGNLSAVLAQMARDEGESGIIGQVLNGPVTCHPDFFPKDKFEYTSWVQNQHASILGEAEMRKCWNAYVPGDGGNVYASPLLAKTFKGLPPAIIQISGMDPLRDEAFAYADRLKEVGIPVEVVTYPGLPHGFYTIPQLPATPGYLQAAAFWVRDLLAKKAQV